MSYPHIIFAGNQGKARQAALAPRVPVRTSSFLDHAKVALFIHRSWRRT